MTASHDPGAFLGLEGDACSPDRARVRVLPVPFEATVSYGAGTAGGPDAILAASRQVELYDRHFDAEPAVEYGVHTLPALAFDGKEAPEAALARVADAAERAARDGAFLLALGGEHSITPALFDGVARARGGSFTVVHFDAHADLRHRYDDTPHSHACALRRVLEHPACERVLQLGIRSLSSEEAAYLHDHPARVRTWFADQCGPAAWEELAGEVSGKRVYVTFDVDALDPSLVPATGTPEPDGLTWRQALAAVEAVAEGAEEVVALDGVELAPEKGLHHADFTVAKLLYAMTSRLVPAHLPL